MRRRERRNHCHLASRFRLASHAAIVKSGPSIIVLRMARRIFKSLVLVAAVAAVAGACGGVLWQSYQTSRREAAVFASLSATAFEQGFCDRALRLAMAGLPPTRGSLGPSFRTPQSPRAAGVSGGTTRARWATRQGKCCISDTYTDFSTHGSDRKGVRLAGSPVSGSGSPWELA